MATAPGSEVTIVVTSGEEFIPEVSTVTARLRKPTTRDVGTAISFLNKLLPFFIFFSSLSCAFQRSSDYDFIVSSTFISVFLYHVLALYTSARKGNISAILDVLRSNPNFLCFLLDLTLYYSRLAPFLFFLDHCIETFRAGIEVLQNDIAPLITDAQSQTLRSFSQEILDNPYPSKLQEITNVLMTPYLFLMFITSRNPRILLSIAVSAFSAHEKQKKIWSRLSDFV